MAARAGQVPVAVLSRLFGLSDRRIQQLVKEGILPRATRGLYPLIACVQSYVEHLSGELARARTGGDGKARDRLDMAKAKLAELELAEREGILIDARIVEQNHLTVAMAVRTKLLAIPAKAAPLVHASNSIAEAESVLRDHLYEALEDIAATQIIGEETPEDDSDSGD